MITTILSTIILASVGERVLVVENADSPTSVQISSAYRSVRSVKNRCIIFCQDSAKDAGKETIDYASYRKQIEQPIRDALKDHPEIDFVVLTKGIPIRVTGAKTGINNDQPSVDSSLAALGYDERTDVTPVVVNETGFKGKCWVNRYWNSDEPFSHQKFGGYLVTRLDGYTLNDALALIGSAQRAEKLKSRGAILLDAARPTANTAFALTQPSTEVKDAPPTMNDMPYQAWDEDLKNASEKIKALKIPVTFDETAQMLGGRVDLGGYASWGSNDGNFTPAKYQSLTFVPGAIAETAVSTSARTFLPTKGGQSLIADLIAKGVTGVKGYCDEPFLQAIASPTVLFSHYVRGFNLAESMYAASRYVGWEDIVVGDPLCRPYRP